MWFLYLALVIKITWPLLKDGKEEGEDTSDSDLEESRPEVPIPKVIIASPEFKAIISLISILCCGSGSVESI